MATPDQASGPVITDQKALEKIFRANYDRWIKDAKGRLGDAGAAAPRVVSKAFHLAWQDRKRFTAPEELDAYIGAQIHHGATREISRRAGLHRMDHHEGLGGAKAKHETHEMDVNEAWDRLSHTLEGGAPEAYRARASAARHEAADHMKELGKERDLRPFYALGAIAALVAIGGMMYVRKTGTDRAVTSALNAQDVRNYESSYGQRANITLDDGTLVTIGPESKLTIPRKFNIGIRAVKIEGTAHFDVTTPGDLPFEVRAGNAAIIARGTAFTVRRYSKDDSITIVNVKSGSVDLKYGEKVQNVATGMTYMVTETGDMRVPSAEEIAEASGWVDGNVTISGRPLRYVLPQLRRWFGLDIKVVDEALLERTTFLTAPMGSNRAAIASVEQSAGVKFTYVGQNMTFQDTTPSRPARRR
jgi:ferric-dicitrate binding protein FerR (iron transport regulator)